MKKKVLIVFSGGQDSTTCLFLAKKLEYDIHTLTFDYGQRHKCEIEAANFIVGLAGVNPEQHEVVKLGDDILKSTSPLVSNAELEQYKDHHSLPGGLEKTFVPMRNQLFLTIAANRAYALGISTIITGVCQEDSGGYPDCKQGFIDLFEKTTIRGTFTDGAFEVRTPLMYLSKAQTCRLAWITPGAYSALAFSHTGYDGVYPPTGKDHATLLRAKGFEEANLPDPLVLRAWYRGLMDVPNTVNYGSELIEKAMDFIQNEVML